MHSSGLKPEDLWQLRNQSNDNYQVLTIAANLYQIYQLQATYYLPQKKQTDMTCIQIKK